MLNVYHVHFSPIQRENIIDGYHCWYPAYDMIWMDIIKEAIWNQYPFEKLFAINHSRDNVKKGSFIRSEQLILIKFSNLIFARTLDGQQFTVAIT